MSIINNSRILILGVFLTAFFLGFEIGGLQYSVLKMAMEFNLNSSQMGSIVSVFFIATMIPPILTGYIADSIGKKKVIIISMLVLIGSCFVTSAAESLKSLYIGVFLSGMTFASTESTVTAALADETQNKSGKYISIMQSIFSVGCLCAPLILSFFMDVHECTWRIMYYVCATLAVVPLIFIAIARFNQSTLKMPLEYQSENKPVKIEFLMVLLVSCIVIYQFIENGITFFADSFISIDLHEPEKAAMALSFFWAMMAIFRFIGGLLYKYEDIIIRIGFIAVALFLVAMILVKDVSVALVLYVLLGICCAPIWPLIVAKVTRIYKEHTGFVTGLVLMSGGIGGMASPYIIGVINDFLGMAVAFFSLAIVSLIGMALYTCSILKLRNSKHKTT